MVILATIWFLMIGSSSWAEWAHPMNPNPPVMLVATVNQTTPIVGEPLIYTVLEYRTSIAPNYATLESPHIPTASLWSESQALPDHPSIEYRNQTRYYVYTRMKLKLLPQHAGPITIPPAVSYAERPHVSNPTVLMVKAPPSTRVTHPVSVGQFWLDAPRVTYDVVANAPIAVPIIIHATGNLTIQSIRIGRSHVFRHYLDSHETETTEDPWVQTHRLSYIFIPNRSGDFPLPAIQLWTLDPKSGHYQWLEAPKRYVTVYDEHSPNAAVIRQEQTTESIPNLWKELQLHPRDTDRHHRWASLIQTHPDRHLFPSPPRRLGRYEWLALLFFSAGLAGIAYAYQRHRLLWLWLGMHVGVWIAYFTLYPYPIVLLDAERTAFYAHKDSQTALFMLHRDLPVYYKKPNGNWQQIQLGTGQTGWIQSNF